MKLWHPPHDAPHLLEWWRPLLRAAQAARADEVPWLIHIDQFRLHGRVLRQGRPDIWVYEHHENDGALFVDATGQAYRWHATPKGRGAGQFRQCEIRSAVWKARLPEVVAPMWYEPPQMDDDEEHWANVGALEAEQAALAAGRSVRHLTLVNGGASGS